MARRKGEDTSDAKRRRMPFVAKIKRDEPWFSEDAAEIHSMCKRVAASAEFCSFAGWKEDAGYKVIHFTTWAKARAMQHWIDRSRIAYRSAPKIGLSTEELESNTREAIAWALATGAARRIVRAYCTAGGGTGGLCDALNVAKAAGRKNDGLQYAVESILQWARDNHSNWFDHVAAAATPSAPVQAAVKSIRFKEPLAPTEQEPIRARPLF